MNFREQYGLRPKAYVRCERCNTTPVSNAKVCQWCRNRERMATRYRGRKR